ncbi:class I SAM-dependent methyltransferase [Haloflavibacter putidus]|uniref:Class I SAM-dependent methyltransferase n=1 Tax=Haloflavibacter putidus TaxID=2576776 RepID=A0A507ZQ81_9FLAO|nr:class I SAM-dependent methyltransferase [Haloflavibacter putidus]TQD39479.1 class I SAM-dependent methyltransferase [Haloflavibacter putidus]
MVMQTKNWYSSWFNTKYYHILYGNRDFKEAQLFMDNLLRYLDLKKNASILDLGCGKGRHSIYLNELGYQVTGIDLSVNNIETAKKHSNQSLNFLVHDMRVPLQENFDVVFNLFTSFGYFEDEKDNYATINAIKQELKPGGCGVIDFMNAQRSIKNLVPQEVKTVEGINFHISRKVENNFIIKTINFEDKGEHFTFVEKVKALTLKDFKTYFEAAGMHLKAYFGDYDLNSFDEEKSDRLILIFDTNE